MAKELMQCRHELESCRRVCAEYAERTHAAEKLAARAASAMHEAHAEHARLQHANELVLSEVQVQRSRVSKLRLAASRRTDRRPPAAADVGSYCHGVDNGSIALPSAPVSPCTPCANAARSVLRLDNGALVQPEWNADMRVDRQAAKRHSWPSPMGEHSLNVACSPPPPSLAAPDAHDTENGTDSFGAEGSSGQMLLLSSSGGDVATNRRDLAWNADSTRREVLSLHHKLRALRADKTAAEKATAEKAHELAMVLVRAEDASRQRDELAEVAQGSAAEADLLRRQLQAARTAATANAEAECTKRLLSACETQAPVAALSIEISILEAQLAQEVAMRGGVSGTPPCAGGGTGGRGASRVGRLSLSDRAAAPRR